MEDELQTLLKRRIEINAKLEKYNNLIVELTAERMKIETSLMDKRELFLKPLTDLETKIKERQNEYDAILDEARARLEELGKKRSRTS